MTTEQPKPCPTCGHCPTCGRSNQGQHVYPWRDYAPPVSPANPIQQPYWPYFPVSITCGNSTDGLLVDADSQTITVNPNMGTASTFTGSVGNVTV